MMPSRGVHAIKGNAPRLYQQQCRNLSSRHLPRASSTRLSQSTAQWRIRTTGATASVASVRYASWWSWNSTPSPPPPAQAPAAAPAPPTQAPPIAEPASAPITEPTTNAAAASSASTTPPTLPNLDTITLDDVELAAHADISGIPEGIGYLRQIGLDYGIGPTSGIEWILEHLHIYGGLPWWGAIASTAIILRLVSFPFYLRSADQAARTSAMLPITKPIQDRMSAAAKSGDQTAQMQAWQEYKDVRARAGLSIWAQFTPMVIQSVIGFCGFRLLKAAAALPVPGFQNGGFLWLSDLTVSDGYLLVPALMAASIHVMVRYGGETGSQTTAVMSPGMRSFMLWGMPGFIFLITGWQSGAVCVWFAATGAFGMGQALLLQKPGVRNFFGIAPLYKPTESENAKSGWYNMAMDNYQNQRNGGGSGKTIEATGRSRAATSAGNRAYTAPSYQSPTLRTKTSASGPFQPPPGYQVELPEGMEKAPKKGVLGSARAMWEAFKEETRRRSADKVAQNRAAAKRKATEEYEKRAKEGRRASRR